MADRAQPTFSVVLPTYNRCDVLARTIRHLLDQDYPNDRYEIIVADNSTDGTPAMVEALAAGSPVPIRLLLGTRLPAVKRNEALAAASGDVMVFLNDDLWVEPGFLAEHAASHAASAEPVAVVGHCRQSPEMEQTAFIRWYRPFAYDEIAGLADRPVPYRYFWSMNLSLPRAEMVDHGLLFHEEWSEIGHEDVELGYRWVRSGRQVIYNPRARGDHFHPHDVDSACRLQASVGRGLRDMEVLVPEPDLLERYGVFSWRNRPRAVARGLARRALFNSTTVPYAQRWLGARSKNGPVSDWMYWKVLLHHTNHGYRHAPPSALASRPEMVRQ